MSRVDRAKQHHRLSRFRFHGSVVALCLAMGAGLATTGCRVTEDDIHRWEATAHGPEKLRAVLLHDKYDSALRVEAAISLIRMKARGGRRIGIPLMVDTMAELPPETRQTIAQTLVPTIITELKKPPPVGQAGQPSPPDGSYPYKDAAYAMLTYDKSVIIADEGLKQNLKNALVDWAMADFEHRLDNRTQAYGMEQLLRFIGAPAVVGLPKLMTRDAKRLEQMASLVAELGDDKTKTAGSQALVVIAQYDLSDEWPKVNTPALQAANAASKLQPTPAQFAAQLATFQDEELFRVFGSMKKVGARPAIDFCLDFAAKKESEKRRQAALAALEGRLDRNNPDDIKRILAIATNPDTPDLVLDQAFRRIGEMPREIVVERLYDLFKGDKWKIRRAAAATVLKMSTSKNLDEFMQHLPADGAPSRGFSMQEAFTYGAMLGDMLKDVKPAEALKPWFTKGPATARTSALAWYFQFGTAADLPTLQTYESERVAAPVCDTDPDCKWSCEIPKDANQTEVKDIKTVGDFVKYCIEPRLKEKKDEKK